MIAEHTEHASILVSKVLLDRVANVYTLTTEAQLTSHFLIDTDIKLSNMDMIYHLLIEFDSIVNLLF